MAVIFYPGSGFTKDEDAEDGNINICLYRCICTCWLGLEYAGECFVSLILDNFLRSKTEKISKIAMGWDACFLLGPVMWLHGRSAIFTLFYAVRTTTLLARLTPSITPAGPAPTRSWDGQTIQNLFSEAFFQNLHL